MLGAPPGSSRSGRRPGLLLVAFVGALSARSAAQELVPAACTPAPTGVNLITLAAGYSSGALGFDPSLPVEDVTADIGSGSLSHGRTFGLLGRSADVTPIAPHVQGIIGGDLDSLGLSYSSTWMGRRRGGSPGA